MSTKRLKEFLNLPEMQNVLPTDEPKELKIVLKPGPAPDVVDSINVSCFYLFIYLVVSVGVRRPYKHPKYLSIA